MRTVAAKNGGWLRVLLECGHYQLRQTTPAIGAGLLLCRICAKPNMMAPEIPSHPRLVVGIEQLEDHE